MGESQIGVRNVRFVSAYGPRAEKSEEELDGFWNESERCVEGLGRSSYVMILWDMNERIWAGEVEGILGKYEVPGENERGKRLLDVLSMR